jgi:signal transduction histidine kinase
VRNLHLAPTDLNRQVRRVIDFFSPQAQASGVEIVEYLDADLPSVLLDPDAFYGALLNLVLNAQQAMGEGGQLVIRTHETPTSVALDLIDTGCGMDSKTLSHMFDAFYSTKNGGSGLGLPTTRKIVEAHQGTIAVQSTQGRGTHIRIELPLPRRIGAAGATTDGSAREPGEAPTAPWESPNSST